MTNVGTEALSNIKTVKAHGDEEMTGLRFALENQNCFTYGRVKGYFWSIYFVAQKFLAAGGDVAIIYIICRTYKSFNLSIG